MCMLKTAGIIGGMGAAATVDIFNKIVCQTKALKDQEHIPLLIDNNTQIPDRTDFLLGKGPSPLDTLLASAQKLINMGADYLALACNTSHFFYSDLSSLVSVKILNTVEETANEASRLNLRKIALLGTNGFVQHVNYRNYFERHGMEVVIPNSTGQQTVNDLIYHGIKAQRYDIDVSQFKNVLDDMMEDGVQSFALSCSELPIAFSLSNINYPSTQVLTAVLSPLPKEHN